jgi:hypothetical protein
MIEKRPLAEVLTKRAEQASMEIRPLLHGLGMRTQGAVLADLVSLWLAGMVVKSEAARPGSSSDAVRREMFKEWCEVVWDLVPESEKEIMREVMHKVEPKGSA